MSWMIVKEKLLKRAVVKDNGLRQREKTNTKRDLVRAMTNPKSRMQTVAKGCVSRTGEESSC